MRFHPPDHAIFSSAGAAGAGSSKLFLVFTIVVIVGTALFIGAVAIGLGVGFGVGLRDKFSNPVTLSPPTITCRGAPQCGCPLTAPSFTPRIINGQTAVPNSWPWMVYLTLNNQKTCTGFVISLRHVLTAASCISGYGNNVTVTIGTSYYQSIAYGYNVSNTTAISTIVAGVDIAVVTLGINITKYLPEIQPCCLTTDQSLPTVGTNGVIAGWGETSPTNQLVTPTYSQTLVSPTLQQAVVQVLSPSACGTSSGNDTICASFDSISACPIDAGGPLMISDGSKWTCAGIIIGGKAACSNPIQFIRIAPYFIFIQNITTLSLNYY